MAIIDFIWVPGFNDTNIESSVFIACVSAAGPDRVILAVKIAVDRASPPVIFAPTMNIKTIVVGPFQVNCYLYWDPNTNDGIIIDPGAEEDTIITAVDKTGMTPRAILLTHGHADHIAAVAAVKERFDIPLYIGKGEQDLLANPSANVSAFFDNPIVAPPADVTLSDEEAVNIGSLFLKVLHTPGHTVGGVCYLDESEGNLFCGDTLFWGSVGRTDLPGGSSQVLIDSINKKILTLPDGITCYPGHGPETTVGGERTNNPFLRGDFFA